MPKLDLDAIPTSVGSSYPAPFDAPCRTRRFQRLGAAAGLERLGASRVVLPPGAWSSHRHWHAEEDELVVILAGTCVLVEDGGETALGPGDVAAFKAGVRDGHHLQNRGTEDVVMLAVSNRDDRDWGEYSDVDMRFLPGRYSGAGGYARKDGSPIE